MPSTDNSSNAEDDDEEKRRRAIIIMFLFICLFVGIGFGVFSIFFDTGDQTDGTGEVSVTVTDQNGNRLSGEDVQFLDPVTNEVIYEGKVGSNGRIQTELNQGDYKVHVGKEVKRITVDGSDQAVDFEIDTSPPKSV